MKHHILAKYKPEVSPDRKEELAGEILGLFENVKTIPGIYEVKLHKNCVERDNRFDIMIVIEMDREALESYDTCVWHKQWKNEYGALLEKKAIFDCE